MKFFNKKLIYLDYAAASPVRPEVLTAMASYWSNDFGNPSSEHFYGLLARQKVEEARQKVAKVLGTDSDEIIFTGSGTESVNLALLGVAKANSGLGKHIITSGIEHQAVLQTSQELVSLGFEVTYLPVDSQGRILGDALERAIRPDTILVSLALANNEIGTILPIAELAKIAKQKNPNLLFHTDACQGPVTLAIKPKEWGVDLLSLNASKISGPKGVGLLFCRKETAILPIIFGGGQENNLRSGTENVPGIIGLAIALEIAQLNYQNEAKRLEELRDFLEIELLKLGFRQVINSTPRLANNLFLLAPIESKGLLKSLSDSGLAVSRGSACSAKKNQASEILLALGYDLLDASKGLRFSLGWRTTKHDLVQAISIVRKVLT